MAYYMYCPLDLTVKQQHIYTLLFKKSNFKGNYRVEYTVEQLTLDSDKCFELTDKMVRTIVKQLIEKNYLIEIEKGRRGIPTTYEINVKHITIGNLSVNNVSPIGKLSVTNDTAIPTDTSVDGNLSVNNVSPIGNELVNPIIKKEKEKKKNKDICIDYADIFDHYNTAGLIKHKQLTEEMKKGIDLAVKTLGCDTEEMKRMIDRHKEKSVAMKDNDKFKIRPLAEFFGQKKYQSVALICSDYSDDVYNSSTHQTTIDTSQFKDDNPFNNRGAV